MSKTYKQFFHGKKLPKTASKSKPLKWYPNTYLDTYTIETGKFRSRRKYGKDGFVYKDMDTADSHRPYDHIHDWNNKQRAKEPRKPNKYERQELEKAKKKRRFF